MVTFLLTVLSTTISCISMTKQYKRLSPKQLSILCNVRDTELETQSSCFNTAKAICEKPLVFSLALFTREEVSERQKDAEKGVTWHKSCLYFHSILQLNNLHIQLFLNMVHSHTPQLGRTGNSCTHTRQRLSKSFYFKCLPIPEGLQKRGKW